MSKHTLFCYRAKHSPESRYWIYVSPEGRAILGSFYSVLYLACNDAEYHSDINISEFVRVSEGAI